MLVDIPAAQHKTMFFIVSLDLHVFIDNYPVQTASTTALPRLCVRHHKEIGIFLKPVTILPRRAFCPSDRAEFEEGYYRMAVLTMRFLPCCLAVYSASSTLPINCSSGSKCHSPVPALKVTAGSLPASPLFNGGAPKLPVARARSSSARPGKITPNSFSTVAVNGNAVRLHDLNTFACHVAQHNIPAQVALCVVNGLEVIDVDQRQNEGLMGGQQLIHIIVERTAVLQPVSASWVA